jgi:hypothetical protein
MDAGVRATQGAVAERTQRNSLTKTIKHFVRNGEMGIFCFLVASIVATIKAVKPECPLFCLAGR